MIDPKKSQKLRHLRKMMGLSQRDVYKAIGMNGGQYSEIEAGRLSAEKALKYVEDRFKEWRKEEIEKLKREKQNHIDHLDSQIKYLNSLC